MLIWMKLKKAGIIHHLSLQNRGLISFLTFPVFIEYYSSSLPDAMDSMGVLQDYRESLFSRTKDSMNIEIQQGLEKRLPSHLEMELLLSTIEESKLDSVGGVAEMLAMRTTRSLYMAGFLKGLLKRENLKKFLYLWGERMCSK